MISVQKLSRKNICILLSAVAILTVIFLAVLHITDASNQPNSDSGVASLYVSREGYKHKNGIGDPVALAMESPRSAPASYDGQNVIQACNVLGIEEAHALGLKTMANQLYSTFRRVYFDGSSQGALQLSIGLPVGDSANSCSYPMEENGLVQINVYQPSYVPTNSLTQEVKSYTLIGTSSGQNVYKKTDGNITDYIVGKGDSGVMIDLKNISHNYHQPLIDKVAANFVRERVNAAGVPGLVFKSKLVKRPYLRACQLLRATYVEQLFNEPLNPLVHESSGQSVGVMSAKNASGKKVSSNYVSNACSRSITPTEVDISNFNTREISLVADTFTDKTVAKLTMNYRQSVAKDPRVVSGIGNGAFISKSILGQEITVLVDRAIITITNTDKQQKPDAQKRQQLEAIANHVLQDAKL